MLFNPPWRREKILCERVCSVRSFRVVGLVFFKLSHLYSRF